MPLRTAVPRAASASNAQSDSFGLSICFCSAQAAHQAQALRPTMPEHGGPSGIIKVAQWSEPGCHFEAGQAVFSDGHDLNASQERVLRCPVHWAHTFAASMD